MNRQAYTFSPLRCLSRWLIIPCLLLLIAGFILGRWFTSRPFASVKATDNQGNEVKATLFRGDRQIGTTPCEIRGKRGEEVELIARTSEGGEMVKRFVLKKRAQHETVQFFDMVLRLECYDTQGREVEPAWAWIEADAASGTAATKPEALPSDLSMLVGVRRRVGFKTTDPRYAAQSPRIIEVQWQDQGPYDAWWSADVRADAGLKSDLFHLDRYYNEDAWDARIIPHIKAQSGEAHHPYPLLFVAPERFKKRQDVPPPEEETKNGPTMNPDDPISYEQITSKRQLTMDDIQSKSEKGRWLTKNEIYARHGLRFTTPELQSYFGKCSWYKGTTGDQDQVYSAMGPIEQFNVNFLKDSPR